jgi:hypothetical protein
VNKKRLSALMGDFAEEYPVQERQQYMEVASLSSPASSRREISPAVAPLLPKGAG